MTMPIDADAPPAVAPVILLPFYCGHVETHRACRLTMATIWPCAAKRCQSRRGPGSAPPANARLLYRGPAGHLSFRITSDRRPAGRRFEVFGCPARPVLNGFYSGKDAARCMDAYHTGQRMCPAFPTLRP